MEFLTALWLPILLSAVLVFIASSLSHMVLQFHKGDYDELPDEEAITEPMRAAKLPPGRYVVPHCSSTKDWKDPAFLAKYERGPVGFFTVLPNGMPNMGKFLGQWFAYCLVVGVIVAYIARLGLAPGADYLEVFQLVGATAFIVYGLGSVPESIWKGQSWATTARFVIDGLVYALVTAGAFGWLWPDAIPAVGA